MKILVYATLYRNGELIRYTAEELPIGSRGVTIRKDLEGLSIGEFLDLIPASLATISLDNNRLLVEFIHTYRDTLKIVIEASDEVIEDIGDGYRYTPETTFKIRVSMDDVEAIIHVVPMGYRPCEDSIIHYYWVIVNSDLVDTLRSSPMEALSIWSRLSIDYTFINTVLELLRPSSRFMVNLVLLLLINGRRDYVVRILRKYLVEHGDRGLEAIVEKLVAGIYGLYEDLFGDICCVVDTDSAVIGEFLKLFRSLDQVIYIVYGRHIGGLDDMVRHLDSYSKIVSVETRRDLLRIYCRLDRVRELLLTASRARDRDSMDKYIGMAEEIISEVLSSHGGSIEEYTRGLNNLWFRISEARKISSDRVLREELDYVIGRIKEYLKRIGATLGLREVMGIG